MARKKKIKVKDLPPDKKVTQEELDKVTGGAAGLTSGDLARAGANLAGGARGRGAAEPALSNRGAAEPALAGRARGGGFGR